MPHPHTPHSAISDCQVCKNHHSGVNGMVVFVVVFVLDNTGWLRSRSEFRKVDGVGSGHARAGRVVYGHVVERDRVGIVDYSA